MSSIITPTRRGFLAGLLGLVAAPAIIPIERLMPVRTVPPLVIAKTMPVVARSPTAWVTGYLDAPINVDGFEGHSVLFKCPAQLVMPEGLVEARAGDILAFKGGRLVEAECFRPR